MLKELHYEAYFSGNHTNITAVNFSI